MQSLMFIFLGLRQDLPNLNIETFADGLREKLKGSKMPMVLTTKDNLITGHFEDASYYISFLDKANELKDWYKMAKDFELKVERKSVFKKDLLNRYESLIHSSANLYKREHFSIGLLIFEELEKLPNVEIYSFQ